jgi:hypothetical protein
MIRPPRLVAPGQSCRSPSSQDHARCFVDERNTANRSAGGKKKPNWKKEQPHHVDTGRFVTEDYARKHPGKVEWVKHKK